MKKLVLTSLALTCAASVFAQGTITFNNRVVGSVVTHVYGPSASGGSQIGNGAGDTSPGSTVWTGYPLLSGSNYVAQLLGGPQGTAEGSLQPEFPTTTFRTGAAAGFVAGVTATIAGVLGDTGHATVELVVWDNTSGLYPTWIQARAAWQAGTIAAGRSGAFDIANVLGGALNVPPNLVGLQSFNTYMVPEPASFALAGMGAAMLLIFRRRK